MDKCVSDSLGTQTITKGLREAVKPNSPSNKTWSPRTALTALWGIMVTSVGSWIAWSQQKPNEEILRVHLMFHSWHTCGVITIPTFHHAVSAVHTHSSHPSIHTPQNPTGWLHFISFHSGWPFSFQPQRVMIQTGLCVSYK